MCFRCRDLIRSQSMFVCRMTDEEKHRRQSYQQKGQEPACPNHGAEDHCGPDEHGEVKQPARKKPHAASGAGSDVTVVHVLVSHIGVEPT